MEIHPNPKTGAHHHGPVESEIYVVSGKARMKWGDRLEFTAEAGPGDFIYVPPFVPHQEINASESEPLSCVLCRSGQEPVVVNLDLPLAPEGYVHRIGRTGRAGQAGEAISLVCADEAAQLAAIETLIGKGLPRREVEGFEAKHRVPATGPGRRAPAAPRETPAKARRSRPDGEKPASAPAPRGSASGRPRDAGKGARPGHPRRGRRP